MKWGEFKKSVYDKYPLPCMKECGLEEPCIAYKECVKHLAVRFCRYRDIKNMHDKIVKRQKEQKRKEYMIARAFMQAQYIKHIEEEGWDD